MTPEQRQNDEMFIFEISQSLFLPPGQPVPAPGRSNGPSRVPKMHKYAGFILLFLPQRLRTSLSGSTSAATAPPGERSLRRLAQDVRLASSTRHTAFLPPGNRAIRTIHLAPRPTPRPYLFPELARFALSGLNCFVDDSRFKGRPRLRPDQLGKRCSFRRSPRQEPRLAECSIAKIRRGFQCDVRQVSDLRLARR